MAKHGTEAMGQDASEPALNYLSVGGVVSDPGWGTLSVPGLAG
jgi:hypothetical protein